MDNNYEEDMLKKADIIEQLVHTKGFEYIKSYITERIQVFSNRAIVDGFKSMEEYMFYRGEVSGLRSLLVEIENSLENLNNYRDKQRAEK